MFAFLKGRDPMAEFASRIEGQSPSVGIVAIDALFTWHDFPRNVPLRDIAKLDIGPLPELRKLSDEQAGFGVAALLLWYARFSNSDSPLVIFWAARAGRVTWTQDVACAMLETYPNRRSSTFGALPLDPYTAEILQNTWPKGLPARVKRALGSFLDNLLEVPDPLSKRAKAELRRLDSLAGRDPDENAVVRRQAQEAENYMRLQEEVLAGLGPHMRIGVDHHIQTGSTDHIFAKAWGAQIEDISPEERAQLYVDLARINALKEHPGNSFATIYDPLPGALNLAHLRMPDTLLNSKFGQRKMVFTDAQVKMLLRADHNPKRRRGGKWRLMQDARKVLFKSIIDAIETPDAELAAILRKHRLYAAEYSELVSALCPTEAKPRVYKGTKEEQALARSRDDLDLVLKRLPGMWAQVAGGGGGDWAHVNHQLFPYFAEIWAYSQSINAAVQHGIDSRADHDRLMALIARGDENLALLRAGAVAPRTLDEITQSFPEGEPLRLKNPFATRFKPGPLGEPFDKWGSPNLDWLAAVEAQYMASIKQDAQKISLPPEQGLEGVLFDLRKNQPSGRPTKTWLKRASDLLKPAMEDQILGVIAAHTPGRVQYTGDVRQLFEEYDAFHVQTHDMLSVLWLAHLIGPRAVPALLDYAQNAYKKIPGIGMANEKLGNAAALSLSLMPDEEAAAALMRLQRKVTFSSAKKRVGKLLDEAAERAGVSRDTLEELSVQDHALADGQRRVPMNSGAAVLTAEGLKIALAWEDAGGTCRKAPPKSLKDADPAGIKTARALVKEIEADLATWKDRLDSSYLRDVSWAYDVWRQRYADHGTLSLLARRLIWTVKTEGSIETVVPTAEGCVTASGTPVSFKDSDRVQLWHPLDATAEEVRAWRMALMQAGIVQPFRQAWRETFVLTEAERETGTYSNRFAGHVLRQHQMMALGQANGWQSTHRTGFDTPDDEPSHIRLPAFGLQAEYWTEAAGMDGPTTNGGSYLYISTDRVAFHRLVPKARFGRGEKVALADVPARVFSEIMRHCDLFTSVTSICLDPEWQDRGQDAEHPSAWQQGADRYWTAGHRKPLEGSAATRRDMLELLLPRLKQSKALSLSGSYLRVQGKLNAYIIHIGSAGVLIEDTLRHVCIVPRGKGKAVTLPFDGDSTLSLILSKAVLLCEDHKITDEVIVKQIRSIC